MIGCRMNKKRLNLWLLRCVFKEIRTLMSIKVSLYYKPNLHLFSQKSFFEVHIISPFGGTSKPIYTSVCQYDFEWKCHFIEEKTKREIKNKCISFRLCCINISQSSEYFTHFIFVCVLLEPVSEFLCWAALSGPLPPWEFFTIIQ